MSKIIKKDKVLRRLGVNLWGEPNAAINTRRSRPGLHGTKQVRRSEYGLRLQEKQKLKTYYDMQEKQFRRFFQIAKKIKGNTADRLVEVLERRLQTFVYRMKWGTMAAARQLVSHGHIQVNGKRVDIRSFLVSEGDVVSLDDHAKGMKVVIARVETCPKKMPSYIEADGFAGKLIRFPEAAEVPFEATMNAQAVVELYSR